MECKCWVYLRETPSTINIPVIILTQHDKPDGFDFGNESGIVSFIPKNVFADAVLIETLRQMGILSLKDHKVP